jgi:RNA 3'-terminal phosphate cyclase (ATP)
MLILDGAHGEGGGQILRTALALSLVTGRALRIVNIRANRPRPGLARQHLTAVEAAALIGQAGVEGAALHSQELTFRPGAVRAGRYAFAMPTAGSVTLVLQTVLPALLRADGPSELALEGGTHNPFAPPYDFLALAFLPLVCRMGPRIEVELARHGFYPGGGGKMLVRIAPAPRLKPFELLERGAPRAQCARAVVANLPRHIAERELRVVAATLHWPPRELRVEEVREATGPGNALLLVSAHEQVTEVFTGFGAKGVPAEEVARNVVREARAYLDAGVPVGPRLADQLMLPFALAGGGSYLTMPLTAHARTNLAVIEQFLPGAARAAQLEGGNCRLDFGAAG